MGKLARTVCRPVKQDGRRYRGLNPWSEPDTALHPGHTDEIKQRRHSGRVTRALARLRAHRIIKKASTSYRYQLTRQGRQIVTALLAARVADVERLMALEA